MYQPVVQLGPPREPPTLSEREAIEIALSVAPPETRGLPINATYGGALQLGPPDNHPDGWRVSIDVSALGWEAGFEGPGPAMFNGQIYFPRHVEVPKVRALVLFVHDKLGSVGPRATELDPEGRHRIEWYDRQGRPLRQDEEGG